MDPNISRKEKYNCLTVRIEIDSFKCEKIFFIIFFSFLGSIVLIYCSFRSFGKKIIKFFNNNSKASTKPPKLKFLFSSNFSQPKPTQKHL
jgi:hypothetical protein